MLTETPSLGSLLANLNNAVPDLLVLDVQLPGMEDLEGFKRLRPLAPGTKIVVMAPGDDRASMLAYLAAGANGYLTTAAEPDAVLYALHAVLAGGTFASASPAEAAASAPAAAHPGLAALTGRQRDVFELMARGYATKTIAQRLGVAVGTVNVHLASIFRILGVHSRAAALAKVTSAQAQRSIQPAPVRYGRPPQPWSECAPAP